MNYLRGDDASSQSYANIGRGAAWREATRDGRLRAPLNPNLSPADRTVAMVEG